MGQFIQDGQRTLFETVLNVENPSCEIIIEEEEVDLDGLNYLAGKSVDFVNKNAMKGTILAHTDGAVPNIIINIPEQNEYYLGQLFYFFEFACGVSGYVLGVNPFDQPGVESYKKNMFALLGKPGYEKRKVNKTFINENILKPLFITAVLLLCFLILTSPELRYSISPFSFLLLSEIVHQYLKLLLFKSVLPLIILISLLRIKERFYILLKGIFLYMLIIVEEDI